LKIWTSKERLISRKGKTVFFILIDSEMSISEKWKIPVSLEFLFFFPNPGVVAEVQVYDLALADWTVQGVSPDGNIEVPAKVPGAFFLPLDQS
jgi:hypothetical protein